jgi:hypothetical protein
LSDVGVHGNIRPRTHICSPFLPKMNFFFCCATLLCFRLYVVLYAYLLCMNMPLFLAAWLRYAVLCHHVACFQKNSKQTEISDTHTTPSRMQVRFLVYSQIVDRLFNTKKTRKKLTEWLFAKPGNGSLAESPLASVPCCAPFSDEEDQISLRDGQVSCLGAFLHLFRLPES